MKASDILIAGAGHLKDREATYDQPGGERSIPNVVTAFNALTGHNLTAEQGWLLLLLLKAGRSQQGGYRADNYEDGAAYFALMGEQAAGDRALIVEPRKPLDLYDQQEAIREFAEAGPPPDCPINDRGKVLLPVGFEPWEGEKDPRIYPLLGTARVEVINELGFRIESLVGELNWSKVVGFKAVSTPPAGNQPVPFLCMEHLCKNKAVEGEKMCADHLH